MPSIARNSSQDLRRKLSRSVRFTTTSIHRLASTFKLVRIVATPAGRVVAMCSRSTERGTTWTLKRLLKISERGANG